MHSAMWGNFASQLSTHYRVTLVDLPSRDNLDDIADAVVEQLNDEPFYLLGWSFGGTVALKIAERFANRVQGVVLISSNPCFVELENWAGMPLETFEHFAQQLNENFSATLQRFLALQLQGSATFLKETKARFALKPVADVIDLKTSLELLKNSDLRLSLQNLTCPISAILSDNDALVPIQISQKMKKLQPNLQLTILNDATHIPFVTQPENCLNAIHAFLNGIR